MQQYPNQDPNQSQYPGQQPQFPGQPQWPQQPYYPNQQQPYPGQQYPPQQGQPYYQQQPPMQQQPPKKKGGAAKGCGIAAAVVLVIIVIIVIASASHGGGNTSNASTTTNSSTTSQASASAHKVGDVVTVDGWQVTVNSLTTSQNDPLSQLKSGDTYLEITVSLKNNTGQNQDFSSLISFNLTDSTGQKYDQSITNGVTSPDGNVASGNPLKGMLSYEIPQSTKAFILTFTPGLGSTDTATWNLGL